MPLERVILSPVREQPALRDELLRLRKQALVGVLDHGGHAHRGAPRYHPLDLAILAPVDQVLVPRDPRGPVPEAGHQPQRLVNHGPEVGPLLEVGPLEVERVGASEGFLEAGEGFGLG